MKRQTNEHDKPTVPDQGRLVNTISDAARRLGVTAETIRRRISEGKIATVDVLGRKMIAETELRRVAGLAE